MRVAVWPMSWCMEDSVRSDFDKGGKETMIPNVFEVFIVGLHEIVIHAWNIRNIYVFLDCNFQIEGN
jgi:hypothetical protein